MNEDIKMDKTMLNILNLIGMFRYVPLNFTLLYGSGLFDKEWKIKEGLKCLKSQGYVKCIAVDCQVKHNEKDTFTNTHKGMKLMKELNIRISGWWEALGQSPSLARSRCMCSIVLMQTKSFVNSLALTYKRKAESNSDLLQFKGSRAAGFLNTETGNFSVYSFPHPISVSVKKENRCRLRVMELIGNDALNYQRRNVFDRIIISENVKTVIELLEIKNGKKWLFQNGEYQKCNISKSVFYPNEPTYIAGSITERGYAYLIPVVSGYRDYVKDYFKNPIEKEAEAKEKLKSILSTKHTQASVTKYTLSAFETDETVAFDLTVINLKVVVNIIDAIKNNDKKIFISIIKNNYDFLNELFHYYIYKYNFTKGFKLFYYN